MKKIGASLFLAGFVPAVVAQTNAPATRALSLQDCIAEALQHNFDVRVERYEPVKSQLSLNAAYAGYDPTFNISGSAHLQRCPASYVSPYSTNYVPATVSDGKFVQFRPWRVRCRGALHL